MRLSNPALGALGMAAAPFLWLETHVYSQAGMRNTSLTGACDLLYMLGWAGSIGALLRLRATGHTRAGRAVLYAQLGCLALACVWNLWVVAAPNSDGLLFKLLDAFWPISNVLMLVTGAAVLRAGQLAGWRRFAPLAAGLWLPVTMLLGYTLGDSPITYYGMNGYSLASWFGLGLAVGTARSPAPRVAYAAPVAA